MMKFMLTFKNAWNGYAKYFENEKQAIEWVKNQTYFLFNPDKLWKYNKNLDKYEVVGSFTKA